MQAPVKPPFAGLATAEFAAWTGFLRVHAALVRVLDNELRAAHRLRLTEYEVLLRLADQPGRRMRMSAIAGSMVLSQGGTTRLVERLERRGLVRREPCPEDRRGAYAVLTEDGEAVLRAARRTHLAGVRDHFLRHLSAEEMDTIAAAWARLLGTGRP
jgi:DNA-binding MarR family transcriptional regulator